MRRAAAACGNWAAACATQPAAAPSAGISSADLSALRTSLMEAVGGSMERQWAAVRWELDEREKRQVNAATAFRLSLL